MQDLGTALQVAASDRHVCALTTAGRLFCWGHDENGTLGIGSIRSVGAPTEVLFVGPERPAQIAVSLTHSCARMTDRSLFCWARVNKSGELGYPALTGVFIPTRVGLMKPVAAVATGIGSTCVLSTDGSVQCWGDNAYGQLGLGHRDLDRHPRSYHRGVPLMRLVRHAVALGAALLVVTAAACSSRSGFDETQPAFVGESDAGPEAAAPTCGGRRCSRDLHAVVDDCTDAVVETCAATLGCALGKCVPACDSVAASQGSVGCSFVAIPPDSLPESETSCWAVFIANTWNTPVTVKAEYAGLPLDISKSIYRAVVNGDVVSYERIEGALAPLELGIAFLSQGEQGPNNGHHLSCPDGVEVAWHGTAVKQHKTSRYDAFRITTDAPVSAYSLFPYGGAKSYLPSATLLLPIASWDTNYILVDGWQANAASPFVQIVAQEDNTEVRLRPKVDIQDGIGVTGGVRGSVSRWTLKRGEVLELSQPDSFAGSPIEASHPVAVFGGHQCAFIGNEDFACDSLHQQIAPIHEWSSRYTGVPYKSRRSGLEGSAPVAEDVYWRIVGAADGTTLTYEGGLPSGAPQTLASGQVTVFTTDHPFQVRSQDASHPFFLAVHMSGAEKYRTLGDPEFVTIVPDDQFLDHYVFFLDHTYADSNLTLVRRKSATGFRDVTLDCLGKVTGWQPLGSDGSTEYAWVDMTRARAPGEDASRQLRIWPPRGAERWAVCALRLGPRFVCQLRISGRRGQSPHVALFDSSSLNLRVAERGDKHEEECLVAGSWRARCPHGGLGPGVLQQRRRRVRGRLSGRGRGHQCRHDRQWRLRCAAAGLGRRRRTARCQHG